MGGGGDVTAEWQMEKRRRGIAAPAACRGIKAFWERHNVCDKINDTVVLLAQDILSDIMEQYFIFEIRLKMMLT